MSLKTGINSGRTKMPIFEYKCETCNKKFEVLQSNSTPFTDCDKINEGCKQNGVIHKMISSFAFSGFGETDLSSYQDRSPYTRHTSASASASTGCGCHGTSSCPGSSMRDKYGLD